MRSGLRALDMNILPSDPNQFYVSTDSVSMSKIDYLESKV